MLHPSLNHVIDCQILIYQPVICSSATPGGLTFTQMMKMAQVGDWQRWVKKRQTERERDRASPSVCQPELVINFSRCLVFASERGGVKRFLSLSLLLYPDWLADLNEKLTSGRETERARTDTGVGFSVGAGRTGLS